MALKYGAPLYGADTYGILLPLPATDESVRIQNLAPGLVFSTSVTGEAAQLQVEARPGAAVVGAIPAVAGDLFEVPIELAGPSGTTNVDLLNSTWQADEPSDNVSQLLGTKTVWLHAPADSAGLLSVTSSHTAGPYWLEIYTGSNLADLVLRAGKKFIPATSGPTGAGTPTGPITVSAPIAVTDSVYIRVASADGYTVASLPVIHSLTAISVTPELQLASAAVQRTPGTLSFGVRNGGRSHTLTIEVRDSLDATVAAQQVTVDSVGSAAGVTFILPALPAGTYTIGVNPGGSYGAVVYGAVTYGSTLGLVGDQSFLIVNDPFPVSDSLGTNSAPSAGVQPPNVVRWVFEDPAPGGLGVYTVPLNPESMTSPWEERGISTARTVAPKGVEMHWEGIPGPTQWSFRGTSFTQAHKDTLTSFASIDRRIYITDHRSRTWIVAINSINWSKVGSQADLYHWSYEVQATILGALTAPPSAPSVDPSQLIVGYDSNGVKIGVPTVTLVGSTVNASATVTTNGSVDFTLLQIVVEPEGSGTAFSLGASPGAHSGVTTLSGSGQLTAAGVWRVSVAYAIAPSPVDSDLVHGAFVRISNAIANPGASSQPAATPGAGTATTTVWLGASEKEAANGSLAAWLGSTIDVGGTWCDTYDAQTEQWAIQPGATWGSWNKPLDLAVGGIYKPKGQSWAAAAAGSYDARWQTGLNKIASGWGSRAKSLLYLSFARECNGSFQQDWSVNSGERTNYIAAFQRFVNLARATLPGCNIVWSMNDGSSTGFDFRTAWPGDSYVDIIGVDTYNSWPHVTTQSAFNSKISQVDGYGCPTGIESWRLFAQSKGKPMCIPEWSNDGDTNSDGGGGESPLYVQAMHAWMKAHAGSGAGQVRYAVLFNQWTQYQMWPSTIQPQTAAAWREGMRNR